MSYRDATKGLRPGDARGAGLSGSPDLAAASKPRAGRYGRTRPQITTRRPDRPQKRRRQGRDNRGDGDGGSARLAARGISPARKPDAARPCIARRLQGEEKRRADERFAPRTGASGVALSVAGRAAGFVEATWGDSGEGASGRRRRASRKTRCEDFACARRWPRASRVSGDLLSDWCFKRKGTPQRETAALSNRATRTPSQGDGGLLRRGPHARLHGHGARRPRESEAPTIGHLLVAVEEASPRSVVCLRKISVTNHMHLAGAALPLLV